MSADAFQNVYRFNNCQPSSVDVIINFVPNEITRQQQVTVRLVTTA